MNCGDCAYLVVCPDEAGVGLCNGNPPSVMLLPAQPTREQQIASGGRGQAFALQTIRPTVNLSDTACTLFKAR